MGTVVGVTLVGKMRSCPFCGAAAQIKPWHGGTTGHKFEVSCSNDYCHASPSVYAPTKEKAIERWNMRGGR